MTQIPPELSLSSTTQILAIAYELDPAGYKTGGVSGDQFTVVAYYIVYGCLVPLVVKGAPPFDSNDSRLTSAQQAIYPVVIIILVALQCSALERGMPLGNASASTGGGASAAVTTVEFRQNSTLPISIVTEEGEATLAGS